MSHIRLSPLVVVVIGLCLLAATMGRCSRKDKETHLMSTLVDVTAIPIEVRTVGELDSLRSTVLTSGVRTREPHKVVKVIPDGSPVSEGELIFCFESAGFETRLRELNAQIEIQEAEVATSEGVIGAERKSCSLAEEKAHFAIEIAKSNLDKAISGDGPKELAKRKRALNKAEAKLKNQEAFFSELVELEKEGFLSPKEIKEAKEKQKEKKELYEEAKAEYEHYLLHEYPHAKGLCMARLEVSRLEVDQATSLGELAVMKAMTGYQKERLKLIELKGEREECIRNLAACEVRAPQEGLVVLARELFSDRKRKLRVGDPTFYGQPLAEMPDSESMAVKTKIRERDFQKVTRGALAFITIDAYPGHNLKGEVVSIGGVSEGEIPGEKAFEVTVSVEPMEGLRPGMTARCTLIAEEASGCCTVPLQAVFHNQKGPYCYKQVGKHYRMVPIKLGKAGDDRVQVTLGLKKGDRIALQAPSSHKAQ